MPGAAPAGATRRGVLGAAALGIPAAWLLTGCEGSAPGEGGTSGPGSADEQGPADPDPRLLAEVRAAAAGTEAFLAAVVAAHPRLARRLAPLREARAEHVRVLTDDPAADSTTSPSPGTADPTARPVPRRPRRALEAVGTSEQEYAARLSAAAGAVRSGPLARVLASASVSARMHLAALGGSPTPDQLDEGGPVPDDHVERPVENVTALQRTLEAEHAAVRLYALWAARVSRAEEGQLADLLAERHLIHRDRRDRWEEVLRRAGASPTPAAPDYRGPQDDAGPASAALSLEDRCAQHYAALVAASTGDLRAAAVEALEDAALAQLRLGGSPVAFPGAPEL